MMDDQSTDQAITLFCFAWSDWLTDLACYMSSLSLSWKPNWPHFHNHASWLRKNVSHIQRDYCIYSISDMKISKRHKSVRLEYTTKRAFFFNFFVAFTRVKFTRGKRSSTCTFILLFHVPVIGNILCCCYCEKEDLNRTVVSTWAPASCCLMRFWGIYLRTLRRSCVNSPWKADRSMRIPSSTSLNFRKSLQ